jgi:hypothetical protein
MGRKTMAGCSTSDGQDEVEGITVEQVRTKGNFAVKSAKHWKPKNGVDGDVKAKSKQESNRVAREGSVRGEILDDGSKVTMG